MSFSFRHLQQLGNQVFVGIPKDDRGMIGRECPRPECGSFFKLKPGTGLTGVNLPCHCPYCGEAAPARDYTTADQVAYAKSVALGQITEAFDRDLKTLEFDRRPPRGGFGIRMSLTLKPGPPVPIRYYEEPTLQTDVRCGVCTLEYAIYGVFAFCPDCRTHNSLEILGKNFELVERQLAMAASETDAAFARHLVEHALGTCVSAFDGFGREAVRVRAGASAKPGQCAGVSFQNLDRAARSVLDLFGVDLRGAVTSPEWALLERAFAKRHLIVHRSGVIDQKYVRESGDTGAVVGRRVEVATSEVASVAALLRTLGRGLIRALPAPPARAA